MDVTRVLGHWDWGQQCICAHIPHSLPNIKVSKHPLAYIKHSFWLTLWFLDPFELLGCPLLAVCTNHASYQHACSTIAIEYKHQPFKLDLIRCQWHGNQKNSLYSTQPILDALDLSLLADTVGDNSHKLFEVNVSKQTHHVCAISCNGVQCYAFCQSWRFLCWSDLSHISTYAFYQLFFWKICAHYVYPALVPSTQVTSPVMLIRCNTHNVCLLSDCFSEKNMCALRVSYTVLVTWGYQ